MHIDHILGMMFSGGMEMEHWFEHVEKLLNFGTTVTFTFQRPFSKYFITLIEVT